jgi:cell division transport system ATP-binding protein
VIRFEKVAMRYGQGAEVLHDIDFELTAGSFHFLTGPSGAGKSSLMRLLYLAHRPSMGSIFMFGKEVTALPRRALPALRRRIGVVFQDFRLLEHLTALENVMLPLRIAGGEEKVIRQHAEELLNWVGLGDKVLSLPHTLSGGEQQRVAIARAVIAKPDLLLADEPTGNVDPDMAHRLMHLLIELNKLGTTMVIATHDMHLVQSLSVPRLHLSAGRLYHLAPGEQHGA